MDYSLSPNYFTHSGTGQRMHREDQAVPTALSDKDINAITWSLMEIVKEAGLAGVQFDPGVPATYRVLLQAIRTLNNSNGAPGSIVFTAGTLPLPGTMKANGAQNVSRAVYPELFEAIGTTWGAGDTLSTFGIPDLRGVFIRGLDDGRGMDVGRVPGSFQKGTLLAGYDDNATDGNVSVLTNKQFINYGGDAVLPSMYSDALGQYVTTSGVQPAAIGNGFFNVARPHNVPLLACIYY